MLKWEILASDLGSLQPSDKSDIHKLTKLIKKFTSTITSIKVAETVEIEDKTVIYTNTFIRAYWWLELPKLKEIELNAYDKHRRLRSEFSNNVNYLQQFMLCIIQVIRLTEKVPHLFSSAKVSRLDKTLKKCEL